MRDLLFIAEPRTDSLGMLEEFVYAVVHARIFFRAQCFRGKVVAAAVETAVNHASIECHEVLELFLFDDGSHCLLFDRRKS